MEARIFIVLGLTAIILLSGCIQQKSEENPAINLCIGLCKDRLISEDLSNGPCISDEIYKDWVCDVAHSPRQPVDNIPENQCSAFREGKAHHFVEVDENCNLIRAV